LFYKILRKSYLSGRVNHLACSEAISNIVAIRTAAEKCSYFILIKFPEINISPLQQYTSAGRLTSEALNCVPEVRSSNRSRLRSVLPEVSPGARSPRRCWDSGFR
jgi:hypothetical protein